MKQAILPILWLSTKASRWPCRGGGTPTGTGEIVTSSPVQVPLEDPEHTCHIRHIGRSAQKGYGSGRENSDTPGWVRSSAGSGASGGLHEALQNLVRDVEVGVHTLDIVVVVKNVDQFQHCSCI